jgi:alpha-glucosidase
MPGIPMMTFGDEIGMRGDFGEDGRRPMPWDAEQSNGDLSSGDLSSGDLSSGDLSSAEQPDGNRWDTRILEVYRGLISARKASHALRHGGLRWVHADDDALVFLRESAEQTALVHCSRAAHDPIEIPARHLAGVAEAHTAYGRDLVFSGDRVTLRADAPGVSIWTWPTP